MVLYLVCKKAGSEEGEVEKADEREGGGFLRKKAFWVSRILHSSNRTGAFLKSHLNLEHELVKQTACSQNTLQ